MFNISKYLEKFKKSLDFGDILNNSILEIIKKNTGMVLNTNNLEIKNNIIYIKSSPAVKNKIFIYKENIIKDINKINETIKDIR